MRAAPRGKGAAGRAAVARHLEFVIVRVRFAREEAVVEDDGRRDAELGPARREREAGASLSSCCVHKKLPERRMRRAAAKYGVCVAYRRSFWPDSCRKEQVACRYSCSLERAFSTVQPLIRLMK